MRFLLILPAVRPLPTAVYDTETCEWHNLSSVHRFRHSSWGAPKNISTFDINFDGSESQPEIIHCIMIAFAGMGGLLFSYGGFDHKNPSCSQIHWRSYKAWPRDLSKLSIKQHRGHHQPPIFRQDIVTLAPWKSKAMFEALQVLDIERAIAASLSGVATEGEVLMKHVLASSKTNDKKEWAWIFMMHIMMTFE